MILTILYAALAILGIGFLIFIHELGHYFMARRVGITIEVFAIGFGRPIKEWERNGVKWKIGWLPFGGYVKMAGTEKKGTLELHQIPGGFFSKKPWDRIKVASMGPLVNIAFAFFAFCLLWVMGGREKPFSEFTKFVGWVSPDSLLYQEGVRAGDAIAKVNQQPYEGWTPFLQEMLLNAHDPKLIIEHMDYWQGTSHFSEVAFLPEKFKTESQKLHYAVNAMTPASYLIYQPAPLPKGTMGGPSPMVGSGIEAGDRIVWADGELVFSSQQLSDLVNDGKVVLTVERQGKTVLTRVPRLKISDLQTDTSVLSELDDWRFEAKLSTDLADLFFIPYNVNVEGVVEFPLGFIDEKSEIQAAFKEPVRKNAQIALENGDKILAVQGVAVKNSYDILRELQTKQVLLMVQAASPQATLSVSEADRQFQVSLPLESMRQIVSSIGTDKFIAQVGDVRLLRPITPIPRQDHPMPAKQKATREQLMSEQKKAIEEVADPKKKEKALALFNSHYSGLILGLTMKDSMVYYNPPPYTLFKEVLRDTGRTLAALVQGHLSPKMLQGPVGIVQVMQYSWSMGFKEAFFWLGMISLNLGLINLLPIPVLDGGYICFALYEWITRRPIKAKVMERLIIPFVLLIVGFFIYVTYHDIARILHRFF